TRSADTGYGEGFREYGIDVERLPPQEAGERLRERGSAVALAAALDHWASVRRRTRNAGDQSWKHLLAVARVADPDPWRNQLREALQGKDRKALVELAASDRVIDLPAPTLFLLGDALGQLGATQPAEALLRQAQRRYPDDFWINHPPAEHLRLSRPAQANEAVRFFTVAVALRQQSPGVHNNLGNALWTQGKPAEAEVAYRAAIKLKPDLALAHHNLGIALQAQGKPAEAEAAFRTAIKLKPDYPEAHNNLGNALRAQRKSAEAKAAYRAAIKLKPNYADAHSNLGVALYEQGKTAEAVEAHLLAIKLKPDLAEAHCNLGNALLAQGK